MNQGTWQRRWLSRGLRALGSVLAVVSVAYLLASAAPGDPLHLDADSTSPIPVTRGPPLLGLLRWLWGLLSLELGRTLDGRPVAHRLAEAIPISLALNGAAVLVAFAWAFPLAVVLSSQPRPGWLERALTLGQAVPAFLLGLLLSLLLASPRGVVAFESQGLGVLPVLSLALPLGAASARQLIEAMRRTQASDFVLAARARGVTESNIRWGHVARHGLVTAAALLGLDLASLFTGSVAVEAHFGIQGVGSLGWGAALARDVPLAMGACLAVATSLQVGLLLSEALVEWLDPRLRAPR